jgi:hypothetical protein
MPIQIARGPVRTTCISDVVREDPAKLGSPPEGSHFPRAAGRGPVASVSLAGSEPEGGSRLLTRRFERKREATSEANQRPSQRAAPVTSFLRPHRFKQPAPHAQTIHKIEPRLLNQRLKQAAPCAARHESDLTGFRGRILGKIDKAVAVSKPTGIVNALRTSSPRRLQVTQYGSSA